MKEVVLTHSTIRGNISRGDVEKIKKQSGNSIAEFDVTLESQEHSRDDKSKILVGSHYDKMVIDEDTYIDNPHLKDSGEAGKIVGSGYSVRMIGTVKKK